MLIIADENIPLAREAFAWLGEVRLVAGRSISPDTVRNADLLLVRSVTRVNAALLQGSKVSLVATATAGCDHIDTDYLQQAGIAFASAPGSNAEPVVEYVLACMLLHARAQHRPLHELRVGIVGCGHVGSRLATRLESLGLRCVLNDPPLAARVGRSGYVSLDTVLSADVVSLHVPLVEEGSHPTRRLVSATQLAQLRPGALFINSSRGEVVDEEALIKFSAARPDVTLMLDVWQNEPCIDERVLHRAAIATPHIAGYSYDAKLRGTQAVYQACCSHLGIAATWDYHTHMPPPRSLNLEIGTDMDAALLQAVLATYDPRTDDLALRRTFDQSADQRGAAFDALRKHYPLRREFDSTRIQARSLPTAVRLKLDALGFAFAP